jgi:hypothetical protein
MILAVDSAKLPEAEKILKRLREPFYLIGEVVKSKSGAKSRVVYQ